jgi:hypothetical protein
MTPDDEMSIIYTVEGFTVSIGGYIGYFKSIV